jgi:hypothetical protein
LLNNLRLSIQAGILTLSERLVNNPVTRGSVNYVVKHPVAILASYFAGAWIENVYRPQFFGRYSQEIITLSLIPVFAHGPDLLPSIIRGAGNVAYYTARVTAFGVERAITAFKPPFRYIVGPGTEARYDFHPEVLLLGVLFESYALVARSRAKRDGVEAPWWAQVPGAGIFTLVIVTNAIKGGYWTARDFGPRIANALSPSNIAAAYLAQWARFEARFPSAAAFVLRFKGLPWPAGRQVWPGTGLISASLAYAVVSQFREFSTRETILWFAIVPHWALIPALPGYYFLATGKNLSDLFRGFSPSLLARNISSEFRALAGVLRLPQIASATNRTVGAFLREIPVSRSFAVYNVLDLLTGGELFGPDPSGARAFDPYQYQRNAELQRIYWQQFNAAIGYREQIRVYAEGLGPDPGPVPTWFLEFSPFTSTQLTQARALAIYQRQVFPAFAVLAQAAPAIVKNLADSADRVLPAIQTFLRVNGATIPNPPVKVLTSGPNIVERVFAAVLGTNRPRNYPKRLNGRWYRAQVPYIAPLPPISLDRSADVEEVQAAAARRVRTNYPERRSGRWYRAQVPYIAPLPPIRLTFDQALAHINARARSRMRTTQQGGITPSRGHSAAATEHVPGKGREFWLYRGRDRDLLLQFQRNMLAIQKRDKLAMSGKKTTQISTREPIFSANVPGLLGSVKVVTQALQYDASLVRNRGPRGGYYSLLEQE